MRDLTTELEALLRQDTRLVSEDGHLLKNAILERATAHDPSLLRLLASGEKVRGHFFIDFEDFTVLNLEKFVAFLTSKEWLPDSFTAFKNKIGLSTKKSLLSESSQVVLAWPFKDCVLEGGMTKDSDPRNEIFYNEVLAPDEVKSLLSPKAFNKMTRVSSDGEMELQEFTFDDNGLPIDNLLIKGNNLLGLASLTKQFAGKVKLIYIDPPYNTRGSDDSFRYNDAFNHSTWLTFMKNRLEIARTLLAPDGAIYVQLDYNEVHYCKVLMDEIFGRENFQREIIWRIGWVSGYKTIEKNWIRNHDTILFYAKDSSRMDFIKRYIPYPEGYLRRDGSKPVGEGYAIEDTWNAYGVDSLSDYANDSLDSIAIISFSKEKVGNFKGQKNEALIKRIVEAHTKEGDLILDFFSGTGTTAAVAHKMNRRWIALEQITSQVEIAKNRLKQVIQGDSYGISADVGWKGGGQFVSIELAERNTELSRQIATAKTVKELEATFDLVSTSPFLSYKVDLSRLNNSKNDFSKLPLAEAKACLLEMLDKNAFYVNLNNVDDPESELAGRDVSLTKAFYGEK
jgi:adenine-specific DNA-methyltransferase